MARRKANIVLDPNTRPEVVVYIGNAPEAHGKRYTAVTRGAVDGVRSVLLAGGTSWWAPESDVRSLTIEELAAQDAARMAYLAGGAAR